MLPRNKTSREVELSIAQLQIFHLTLAVALVRLTLTVPGHVLAACAVQARVQGWEDEERGHFNTGALQRGGS